MLHIIFVYSLIMFGGSNVIITQYTDAQLLKLLDNKKRTLTYRKELIRLMKIHFQDEFLKNVLRPMYEAQDQGGIALSVSPVMNTLCEHGNDYASPPLLDMSRVEYFIPDIAFYVMDNPGALSHLHLSVSHASMYKCRRCLVTRDILTLPGSYGAKRKYDHGVKLHTTFARIALVRKWKGERIPDTDDLKPSFQYCKKYGHMKAPIAYLKDAIFDDMDAMESCPVDEFHTMSQGLLKNWVVWVTVCIASLKNLDQGGQYGGGLEVMDTMLMKFPVHFIPEVLKRHHFMNVSYVIFKKSM